MAGLVETASTIKSHAIQYQMNLLNGSAMDRQACEIRIASIESVNNKHQGLRARAFPLTLSKSTATNGQASRTRHAPKESASSIRNS